MGRVHADTGAQSHRPADCNDRAFHGSRGGPQQPVGLHRRSCFRGPRARRYRKKTGRNPRMKLFYHPVSTTCRPILLLAQHDGIELEYQLVDLLSGEHLSESYAAMNPSRQVPLLEDNDFRLTERSAILKYLAEKFHSPSYPADLRQRARVNERMDWFNTGFYRDLGYCLVYPQVIPGYRRENPAVQESLLAWGRERSIKWLTILHQTLIRSNKHVCGNELTIADYLGASILTLGD